MKQTNAKPDRRPMTGEESHEAAFVLGPEAMKELISLIKSRGHTRRQMAALVRAVVDDGTVLRHQAFQSDPEVRRLVRAGRHAEALRRMRAADPH